MALAALRKGEGCPIDRYPPPLALHGGTGVFAMTSAQPTAAVLLIGDEILSGRTKDKNLGFIADYVTALGIDLR